MGPVKPHTAFHYGDITCVLLNVRFIFNRKKQNVYTQQVAVVGLAAEEKTYFSLAIYLAVLKLLMKLLSLKRILKIKCKLNKFPTPTCRSSMSMTF